MPTVALVRFRVGAALLVGAASLTAQQGVERAARAIDAFDVVWSTPSRDASGSMPIGNGEVGANVWVEPDGRLCGYVSRTDSWSEASRLLKLGRFELQVRRPEPGEFFEQRLALREGAIHVTWGTGERRIVVRVFVDSASDVLHVEGESARPEAMVLQLRTWRLADRRLLGEELKSSWTMQNAPAHLAVVESGDQPVQVDAAPARLGFVHRNGGSAVPVTLAHQSLPAVAPEQDLLRHRAFGLVAGGPEVGRGSIRDGREPVLMTPHRTKFAFHIAAPCVVDPGEAAFANAARALLVAADSQVARARTAAWWRALYDRSWVLVDGDPAGGAVPSNQHPLRIGVDSGGQNRFVGSIAEVTVAEGAELRDAAPGAAAERAPDRSVRFAARPGRDLPLVVEEHRELRLERGLHIQAVVTLDAGHPVGRIVDKCTAGGDDGFLFDTHPGHALRLIVGKQTLVAKDVLTPGRAHRVQADCDARTGRMQLRCDGVVVADTGPLDRAPSSPLTQALLLQRHVQAAGGRGHFPIKFNGSIFTVEPAHTGGPAFDADWRRWGDCFWWQNTRLPYHAMLPQGDVEMLEPLFALYERSLPLALARCRAWHGIDGAFFPETMTPFGTHGNQDYGWDRTGHEPKEVLCPWWCYAWNQGPELLALMLDRHDYAPDTQFVRGRILPMATAVLDYFVHRFGRNEAGRLQITPTQSIETYWHGVVNDLPTVAGLHHVLPRLLALPDHLVGAELRQRWAALQASLPPIPRRGEGDAALLAPAERYEERRSNCENPELYAVWPFRQFGLGRPELELARRTFERRHERMTHGWTQDGQQAALLGLVDAAASNLLAKVQNHHRGHRFPAMWGPNFDWLPDQCHGSNLLVTAQCMLLQPVGERLLVLPCWPAPWAVSFRLHAPGGTVVTVEYAAGKVAQLEVQPAARRAAVVLPAWLAAEAQRLGVGHL